MLPDEKAALLSRPDMTGWVSLIVRSYGLKYPSDFAGSYIDRSSAPVVVAAFSNRVAAHEEALRQRTPFGSVAVSRVAWSLVELQALQDSIEQAQGVFAEFDATLDSVGVDPRLNAVVIRIRTVDQGFPTGLLAALGAQGMTRLEIAGFDFSSLPTGTLSGRVVDRLGMGIRDLLIDLTNDIGPYDPHGDVGVATDGEG